MNEKKLNIVDAAITSVYLRSVIRDQIEEIAEKLKEANLSFAFRTTIQKVGNYHALT